MQQQRVVRALHLQEMAACCDAEAATWRLLWHLYGTDSRAYPGSLGGPKLPGCTGALTVAQQIAAMLEEDAELNRCGEPSWPKGVLSRLTSSALHSDTLHDARYDGLRALALYAVIHSAATPPDGQCLDAPAWSLT